MKKLVIGNSHFSKKSKYGNLVKYGKMRVRAFERREKEEEEEKKKQGSLRSSWFSSGAIPIKFLVDLVHVSMCNFELNLLYVRGFNDSKCLGKEPLMLRGFRVGKTKEKSQFFWGKGWPASCDDADAGIQDQHPERR
uniref:Uncharacterized protein n=1 Tax=Solanum tuberosum TaxID=4113 RepID=M1DY83_SOLTU